LLRRGRADRIGAEDAERDYLTMSARPIGKPAPLRLIRATMETAVARPSGFALPRVLLALLGLICRPRGKLRLDAFSGHMLRDIGIDPGSRDNSSSSGFWR
jgi:uncharacterized protein YjiS (DUF1127 family)